MTFHYKLLAAAAVGLMTASANAGEVYGSVGLPGVMLGYAQPLNADFTLRGDVSTLGNRDDRFEEEGITYQGKLEFTRLGLFADWFPFSGGFRLTGGVTFNDMKLDLRAEGAGQTVTIGGRTAVLAGGDRFDVQVKFPGATPYLGIGYGHQSSAPGWGFLFDLGASFGRAKVSGSVSGPTLGGQVSQQDIDTELAELRDGAAKYRYIPQISFGVNYRF